MRQIVNYIENMLPYMVLAIPLIAVWRTVAVMRLKKKGGATTPAHEIGLLIFSVFLIGLASQTIVPQIVLTHGGIEIIGVAPGNLDRVNLELFKVIEQTYNSLFKNHNINYFLINFVGNIVMFMPVGFFVPLLWKNEGIKKVLLCGFLTSLFIELCQLPLDRGTDVDDLWLNTLGAVLGFLLFLLFRKLWPEFTKKFKVRKQE